ncbi:hypothetical protein BKA70DRAFT_824384 [Coprinopsis sp. MPI-PUGE-AT-0042]|nr:hypothetical protein BKA70DRAFT_824384 [Coprinopsis sp. MPI-PUGE-AT-0042]
MSYTPCPPPEVWTEIFRFATASPSSSLERFQLGPHSGKLHWQKTRGYQVSLKTKRTLVLTCREWHAIATPLLYEHIVISTLDEYNRMVRVFTGWDDEDYSDQELVRGGDFQEERYGRRGDLVSRLDLFLPDAVSAFDSAMRLCDLFPQLRCLIALLHWKEKNDAGSFLSALPSCLQHLILVKNDARNPYVANPPRPRVSLASMVIFLSKHQYLETLSHPFIIDSGPVPPSREPVGSSIRTMAFQNSSQVQAMARLGHRDAFPQLRSLNVLRMDETHDEKGHSSLINFLSTHAQNLRVFAYPWHTPTGFKWNTELLQWLGCSSSRIDEVHIWFHLNTHWWEGLRPSVRPELVQTLGIHVTTPGQVHRCRQMVAMQSFVSWPWTSAFINLKTIRIMDRVHVEGYRLHNSVTQQAFGAKGRAARHPIRVEDISGRLLAQFSAGICGLDGVSTKLRDHCSSYLGR